MQEAEAITTDHVTNQESGQVWPPRDGLQAETPLQRSQVAKMDARGVPFNISKCGACDGSHEHLTIMEYARQPGPFSHWFVCPNTGDPVNVTLGTLPSGEGLEFNGAVIQDLAKAQMAGRYMAIICYVEAEPDANGKFPLRLVRHGCKFPSGDVYQSKECEGLVGLLMRNLKEEFGDPQPVEMKAVKPHPLKSLVERAKEASEVMHPIPPQ